MLAGGAPRRLDLISANASKLSRGTTDDHKKWFKRAMLPASGLPCSCQISR